MSTAPNIDLDPTGKELWPDPTLMRSMLSALFEPGDVLEVRIPKPRREGPARLWPRAVYSGFFDDPDLAVSAVSGITGADCPGVYVTLNPLDPDLLGRGHNRIGEATKTAADADVVRLRHLLVDIDPVRKTDLNATEAEHQLAGARMQEVQAALCDLYQWPEPVWQGSSGSGALLIYPLDLEPTPEHVALIEQVLAALAERFSDDLVKLDPSVANPSRLVRLAGTVNAKSLTPQPNRPWRLAVGRGQARTVPVSTAMLAAVAGPAEAPGADRAAAGTAQGHDLAALLTAAEIGFREKVQPYGTVYRLDCCLTSEDHLDGAALIQFPSGAVAYRCLHDRCRSKSWADVRDQLGITHQRGAQLTIPGH